MFFYMDEKKTITITIWILVSTIDIVLGCARIVCWCVFCENCSESFVIHQQFSSLCKFFFFWVVHLLLFDRKAMNSIHSNSSGMKKDYMSPSSTIIMSYNSQDKRKTCREEFSFHLPVFLFLIFFLFFCFVVGIFFSCSSSHQTGSSDRVTLYVSICLNRDEIFCAIFKYIHKYTRWSMENSQRLHKILIQRTSTIELAPKKKSNRLHWIVKTTANRLTQHYQSVECSLFFQYFSLDEPNWQRLILQLLEVLIRCLPSHSFCPCIFKVYARFSFFFVLKEEKKTIRSRDEILVCIVHGLASVFGQLIQFEHWNRQKKIRLVCTLLVDSSTKWWKMLISLRNEHCIICLFGNANRQELNWCFQPIFLVFDCIQNVKRKKELCTLTHPTGVINDIEFVLLVINKMFLLFVQSCHCLNEQTRGRKREPKKKTHSIKNYTRRKL